MANWQIVPPRSQEEWDKMYQLRFSVLREPWSEPKGSEKSPDDAISIHAIILDKENNVIATCRAHQSGDSQAQLRFMAVHPDHQGLGLGKAILKYIEKKACDAYNPVHQIILHAREPAVSFYKSNGYEIVSPSYLLFDSIPHFLMVKTMI
ncbi:MAG: GNAT family N-acetyltransferase [Bacteroidia bacterium]